VNIARDCDPRRAFRRRSGGNNGAGINNTAVDAPERKKTRSKSDKRSYPLVAIAGTRCTPKRKREREREKGRDAARTAASSVRSFAKAIITKSSPYVAVRSSPWSRGCRRQRGMGTVRSVDADGETRSESTTERGKQLREQKNGKQL